MCSIFGFVSRDGGPRLEALRDIVRGNIGRGPHAFGFAWVDAHGRIKAYKQTGRLTDDLGTLAMARDARLLIGHLRWATHGDAADNANNHPHPSDGGWIVHNGVVRNHARLASEYDLQPVSECDSEILGLLMEQGGKPLASRCASAVQKADGPLAMLGLWSRPGKLLAVRRGNPLHTGDAREGIYLATLPAGLPGRVVALGDNQLVQFGRSNGRVVRRRWPLATERSGSGWHPERSGSGWHPRQGVLYAGG